MNRMRVCLSDLSVRSGSWAWYTATRLLLDSHTLIMHPTLRLCNAGRVRQPLIHFIGKRQWPTTPEAPHPHPAAPEQVKQSFSEFLKKFKASASSPAESSSGRKASGQVFEEFWQAPERFWKRELQEWEIELVATGGASRY